MPQLPPVQVVTSAMRGHTAPNVSAASRSIAAARAGWAVIRPAIAARVAGGRSASPSKRPVASDAVSAARWVSSRVARRRKLDGLGAPR